MAGENNTFACFRGYSTKTQIQFAISGILLEDRFYQKNIIVPFYY